jgi:hypothetical protein
MTARHESDITRDILTVPSYHPKIQRMIELSAEVEPLYSRVAGTILEVLELTGETHFECKTVCDKLRLHLVAERK